ncbi:metalloprotease [Coemansia sp. RSA 1721]|nr:metalloprotease [Coemansia sp. RSA 1721]
MGRTFELLDKQTALNGVSKFMPPLADFQTGFVDRITTETKLPYSEFDGDLNKSESDVREYRLIRLPNGLVAMVIHDEAESKACAALDVNVGSLADPPALQGLAHFCEHLLFLYLSAHGGYSNAYTDLEDTCYYFEVTYDALEGALDRFSQFFIDPLFAPDCTDREVRAVDSEHKKNIQSDMWRQYQIEKELSNPGHPFSLFATGNYDTLSGAAKQLGVDLRGELLDFHAKYYSADIMKLVIVGRDSLDQLTEWAVSNFSPIQSKGMTKPVFKAHPLTKSEMGKLIRIKSIRQQRTLDLTFSLPDIKPYYKSKPGRYLGSLIGHEGKGSILSFLKKRGWATSIVAGRSPTSAEGFDMFKITVSLTETGMQSYQDVIRAVFAFIQLLLSKGPQKWFQDELRRVSEIEYRFMEKNDTVSMASVLASTMQNRYLPPESILPDCLMLSEFNEDLLEWVQAFLNPLNFRILLAARDLAVDFVSEEKYYGVNYRVDPIPRALMRDLQGELWYDELHLPEPNCFIPDNLVVKNKVAAAQPADAPTLLKLTTGLELWFKQDDRFLLPRGNIQVTIETPRAYESPLNSIFSQLFVLILKDSLAEITYDAQIAGLWFNIRESVSGISLQIDGFDDKLVKLLRILLESVKSHRVDDTQFEMYSREVRKKLDNAKHSEPYNHAQTNTHFLNQAMMWRYTDKQHVFDLVTKQRLQSFIDTLFEQTRIQMLVLGNFSEAEALDAADMVLQTLDSLALPEYARRVSRALLHNEGCYVHHEGMPDEGNVNSSVDMSIYAGRTESRTDRVLMDLLLLIAQEPFFDQLRTKEQLGYITYCSDRKYSGGMMALRLLVQSESNPTYVCQRILCFIRGFRQRLADMTQPEFDKYVNSLRVRCEEKLKNIFEEASRFLQHISSGYYEFDRISHDLATLRAVTKDAVLQFWDAYVNPDSAAGFKALTSTVWSAKIYRPSALEMARFPEPIVSLHGCLWREGAENLALEAVDEFVAAATKAAKKADDPDTFKKLVSLYRANVAATLSDDDVAKAVDKISEQASYVRTALEMALEPRRVAGTANGSSNGVVNGSSSSSNGTASAHASKVDLKNIGAVRTPGGAWLFEEASAYRASLKQSGAPIPVRHLEPKYP